MTVWDYVIGAILIVVALLVIAVVLLQEGREANLGAISGAADGNRLFACYPYRAALDTQKTDGAREMADANIAQ